MGLALNDWKCDRCGGVEERLEERGVERVKCSQCSGMMERIFSFRGQMAGEESPWVATCLEVVDKNDRHPATRMLLANPTRTNLKRWMKAKGLRHFEDGEKDRKPEIDPKRHADKIMELRYDRRRLGEVR